MDEDRNGVLLVRVWLEGGTDEFRARLTTADGDRPGDDQLTFAVTSSPDGVSRAVRSWLGDFLRSADGGAVRTEAGEGPESPGDTSHHR